MNGFEPYDKVQLMARPVAMYDVPAGWQGTVVSVSPLFMTVRWSREFNYEWDRFRYQNRMPETSRMHKTRFRLVEKANGPW